MVAASSHCTSSMATTTGRSRAASTSTERRAIATALGSGSRPVLGLRSSATSSASRWGAGNAGKNSSAVSPIRSLNPTNDSRASDSSPVQRSTRQPRIAASSSVASHTAVLPIPGLALDDERSRTAAHPVEEATCERQFLVASDDAAVHGPARLSGAVRGVLISRLVRGRQARGGPSATRSICRSSSMGRTAAPAYRTPPVAFRSRSLMVARSPPPRARHRCAPPAPRRRQACRSAQEGRQGVRAARADGHQRQR